MNSHQPNQRELEIADYEKILRLVQAQGLTIDPARVRSRMESLKEIAKGCAG